MGFDKKIIKEEPIMLNKKEYIEVTFEDGEQILKRYNTKYKMWVILEFKPDDYDDSKDLENIRIATRNALLNTILIE